MLQQVLLRWEGVEVGQRYTVAGISSKSTDAVKLIPGQVRVNYGIKIEANNGINRGIEC